jgi:hypothetical protein
MCNECTAPTFDSSKPRELSRYFEDLEQLIKCTSISDQQDMKKQVLHYVDFSTEQIWKTFPEFLDDNKTYKNFKDAILVHYPDASGNFVYVTNNMSLLFFFDMCLPYAFHFYLSEHQFTCRNRRVTKHMLNMCLVMVNTPLPRIYNMLNMLFILPFDTI